MIDEEVMFNAMQEAAFKNAEHDLRNALHAVKTALHYLYETGDYESSLLDEHVAMLQDIESEMENLLDA